MTPEQRKNFFSVMAYWHRIIESPGIAAVVGRELTLLGKWAIFFSNYLLVNYCGISSEFVGESVEVRCVRLPSAAQSRVYK